jgi:trk/ktr system potassium uptake protein
MAWKDRLNNFLYNSRVTAQILRRVVVKLGALVALGLVLYIYGFEISDADTKTIFRILDVIFLLYVLNFSTKLTYSFQRIAFLKENLGETIITLVIVVNGISKYLISYIPGQEALVFFGVHESEVIYSTVVTFFILMIIGVDFLKGLSHDRFFGLKPAYLLIISFFGLSIIGTILLMMPKMTTVPGQMNWVDSLFTSVSATCVTGLIVEDTATFFTLRGKLILLMLMQLGGIGIVSFATIFAALVGKGFGIRQQSMVLDVFSEESLFSAKGLIRRVVLITLFIELIGAFLIYITYDPAIHFESMWQKSFHSVFHSVSAFCNAGFTLYTDGYFADPYRYLYVQHMVIALLIIFGGIGFGPLQDLFSIKKLRERLKKPWVDWKLSTKVAVFMSGVMIFLGALGFYVLEIDNTLANQSNSSSVISAVFQSVTTRTAGFNTVDIGALRAPTLILIIFLMFIGASPGSTGGGIKTSTFLLILMSVLTTIRGKNTIEIGKRTIPQALFYKALTVFAFAATYNLFLIFLLSISEKNLDIFQITFEQVSAFATVGLSTGITSDLSNTGKLLITSSMFFGRIGTLTLALALAGKRSSGSYKYPTAHIMVG